MPMPVLPAIIVILALLSHVASARTLPKVFGAGLSGTGTQALAEALKRIGYNRVVHGDHMLAPYMHGGVYSDGTPYRFEGGGRLISD